MDPLGDRETAPLRAALPADQVLHLRADWIDAARVAWRLRRHETSSRTLHAWSEAGLRAALLSPKDWPIVYHLSSGPSRPAAGLLRLIDSGRLLHVRAFPDVLRHRAVQIGLTPSRCDVDPPDVHVLRSALASTAQREAIRRALQINPSDIALLLPGPETLHSGHRQAAWASALVHVLDARYRLVTWGAGTQNERLRRFVRGLGHAALLSVARDRLPDCDWKDLLPAADAVLCGEGRNPSIMQIAGAAATGATVIAADTPPLRSIARLTDGVRFATSAKPRHLASAVLDAFSALPA